MNPNKQEQQRAFATQQELLDEQEHFKRLEAGVRQLQPLPATSVFWAEADNPDVAVIARDGACHEVVLLGRVGLLDNSRDPVA